MLKVLSLGRLSRVMLDGGYLVMFARKTSLVFLTFVVTAGLAGCGGTGPGNLPVVGGLFGGAAEKTAGDDGWAPAPVITPESRAIQVAYTSVKAEKCGFVFDPNQLRSSFLAAEARTSADPASLTKTERAYDYTAKNISARIGPVENYCSDARTRVIKSDLKRHLAGDFNPPPPKRGKKTVVYKEEGDTRPITQGEAFGEAFER